MNLNEHFKQQVERLYAVVRLQRGLRLGLRVLWLFGAGVLLGWGINKTWGVLPGPHNWIALGLLLALLALAGFVRALLPAGRWVWKMDRLLGLREQASTAWEVARTGERGGLGDALVEEVSNDLPRIHERVRRRGWNLRSDLVSSAVVLLLGFVVLASNLVRPYADLLGEPPAAFFPPPAPLPSSPDTGQEPPINSPPQAPQDGTGQEQGSQPGSESDPAAGDQPSETTGGTGSDPGAVQDALRGLGESLSPQAGTHDLGQALEDLDLEGAAGALEDLSGRLDGLSPQSRANLEQSLEDAAGSLGQAGEESLSQEMQDAAGALPQDGQAGQEQLGELADALRELAGRLPGSGLVSGSGDQDGQGTGTGSPEPLARLDGESGDFNLPVEETDQSGLLGPAPPGEPGQGTASGSLDSLRQPGDNLVQSPLLPNSLLWKWRDVVSQYFQR